MKVVENKRQKLLFLAIAALGISSIITQIIAIREFLSVFQGNELVFGIILANWLLLVGLGAYLGKYFEKAKIGFLIVAQIIIAFLPFLHIFFIRNLRNIFFLPGQLLGIVEIFFSSFVILLPYCLISGFLLTYACNIFSLKKDSKTIGKVYFIDNIGDIIGGLLFSFILIYFFNPFQIVFLLMFINLISAIMLSKFIRKYILFLFLILLLAATFISFLYVDLDELTREQQYKNQELLEYRDTPYGNLVVTKTADQINFYENGVILFTTQNTIANEETIHYAMVQVSEPKDVLLISGGVSGTVNEILKYGAKVDYVELDPGIIELGKEYTKNIDNVNVINNDGRLFVKRTKNKYDLVIVDLPDPSTAQLNRFYTVEFFSEVKNILKEDGVISSSLSSSENYLNLEIRKLNSALYNSLKEHFNNIIIIPGDKNFFIASDNDLSYDISSLVQVDTKYVNEFYLTGKLTKDRIDYAKNSIIEDTKLNKDFNPVTYYYHLLHWMRHFRFNVMLFFIFLIALMVIYLMRIKPIPFALFTSGFAASSLEIVILIGFQVLYGYAYHQLAILITSFMIGLAVGSYYMNKKIKEMAKKELVNIQYSIFFYSLLLPLMLLLLNRLENVFLVFVSS
ncbi:MAG: fused MFS/spermidine synthase, partial [Nanoarchaeota archaeon]|nr:fused MFS/spermidine synthase [Nanoarchaeota archaeon]